MTNEINQKEKYTSINTNLRKYTIRNKSHLVHSPSVNELFIQVRYLIAN